MYHPVKDLTVHDNLLAYAASIVDETRKRAEISVGASPRALLSMVRCAQAIGYLAERDYCIPEDILEAARLTLPHRLILTGEARLSRITGSELLEDILRKTRVQ